MLAMARVANVSAVANGDPGDAWTLATSGLRLRSVMNSFRFASSVGESHVSAVDPWQVGSTPEIKDENAARKNAMHVAIINEFMPCRGYKSAP
mmetsp:Transcript_68420/g.206902  ORF Transcript_68420/g.206902 Transcript_68420/m.206902 type:complete len:93 (+) Transcript_68420:60-338(+)